MIYYYIENLNLQNIIVYNIFPENWRSIYLQKIKFALDRNIAEFNYNLLHNMLCCKKIMFKWKKLKIHVTNALCALKLKIFNILYSSVRMYEAFGTFYLL